MNGIDSALSAVTDHPYIAGGAVILGLFLMTRGGGDGGGQGPNLSASLASMQIASDTNVALAGIQASRDAVVTQAQRDVALGSIEYAKTDRAASLAGAIAAMDNSRVAGETFGAQALQAFQSALGFTAAKKDLENQRASLDSMTSLGFDDINVNRELGAASIASSRDLGISEINAGFNLGMAEIDLSKTSLPFNERMHLEEQATIRNLAWRQKQIAKIGANADIFGGLISSGFGSINSAMSIFGGK